MHHLQINQILAYLSQEHHLPGGDSAFSLPEEQIQCARCTADCLHANNPDQVLSNLPLKIIILLLTNIQVEKFV